MTRFTTCQKGFTLAELLVALTILAIGLLSIAGMQVVAMQTNSRSNTLTTATALAEGVMEEILSWDPENPILQSDTGGAVDWDLDPDTAETTLLIDGAGTYRAQYDVDVDYQVENVIMVTVSVTGTDPGNQNRTITLVGFKKAV